MRKFLFTLLDILGAIVFVLVAAALILGLIEFIGWVYSLVV